MSQLVLISYADIIIKTSCKMLKLVPFQLQRKCKMTQVMAFLTFAIIRSDNYSFSYCTN